MPFHRICIVGDGQNCGTTNRVLRAVPNTLHCAECLYAEIFIDSEHASIQARAEEHNKYTSDDLLDPSVDAYFLAGAFDYQFRWTGRHFAFFRQLVRAMCMDSGQELRHAWKAIIDAGGPEANPKAVEFLERMPNLPIPITWTGALETMSQYDTIDYMREWTIFFRNSYKEVEEALQMNEKTQYQYT